MNAGAMPGPVRSGSIATGALLGIIEQAGMAIATLTEGLEHAELLHSRLTRAEVLRQLRILADSAAALAPEVRQAMPEVDWPGWQAMRAPLALQPGVALDDALWFACESLVPATLLWLRFYRQNQAGLFRMTL
ncbi:MAG TPA: hypothetical protein VGC24_11510 [Burkholderiaceae bacterium]